jgi:hypothetical protein
VQPDSLARVDSVAAAADPLPASTHQQHAYAHHVIAKKRVPDFIAGKCIKRS